MQMQGQSTVAHFCNTTAALFFAALALFWRCFLQRLVFERFVFLVVWRCFLQRLPFFCSVGVVFCSVCRFFAALALFFAAFAFFLLRFMS